MHSLLDLLKINRCHVCEVFYARSKVVQHYLSDRHRSGVRRRMDAATRRRVEREFGGQSNAV